MKRIFATAALLLLGQSAIAAQLYQLTSVTYFNSFAGTPISVANCIGCGSATAFDDGLGNISLSGISWYWSAGGNTYTIAFDGTTTLALGTTLSKDPGHTCVDTVGSVCSPLSIISGIGFDTLYTGIGSDNSTACANDRCRIDVDTVGPNADLRIRIKRALSESATSGASQTYTLTFAPVPVPAAVWLIASALGLLGFVRRAQVRLGLG